MPAAPLDFYFDFSSPYSYITNEWIGPLAARHSRTVRHHALLLGATFQVTGLKSPVAIPLKGEYSLHDFKRSARFEGVPLQMPTAFPVPTQNAARIFWWLSDTQGGEAASAWATAGLRALFTRDLALNDNEALMALAESNGIDPQQAEAVCSDPAWKARLKRANDEAIATGIFGAPWITVDGEPFWGNDRKPQVERWLAHGPF